MKNGGDKGGGVVMPFDIKNHQGRPPEGPLKLLPDPRRRLAGDRIQLVALPEIDIDDVVAPHPAVFRKRLAVNVDSVQFGNFPWRGVEIADQGLKLSEFIVQEPDMIENGFQDSDGISPVARRGKSGNHARPIDESRQFLGNLADKVFQLFWRMEIMVGTHFLIDSPGK